MTSRCSAQLPCCLVLSVIVILCTAFGPSRADAKALAPDLLCLTTQCGLELGACGLDEDCRSALSCSQACDADDPDERQICLIHCVEAKPTRHYDELTSCMVRNSCMPKAAERRCAVPRNKAALAPTRLADLEGSWYVIRGLSKSYDCWPCQKMTFTQTQPTQSRYDYDYLVKASHLSHIDCTLSTVPDPHTLSPQLGHFSNSYVAHGAVGGDDWYVLSQPSPEFALIYYCGTNSLDSYRGGVVVARHSDAQLPAAAAAAMRQALVQADLEIPASLEDFCSVEAKACPAF